MNRLLIHRLTIAASLLFVFLLSACGGAEEPTTPTSSETPSTTIGAPTPSPSAAATLTDAEAQDGSAEALRPAPVLGGPCPVQQEICDSALDLYQRVREGDIHGLMADAVARPEVCPDPATNFGMGNSQDACEGAAIGEVRPAYSVSSGGEGLLVGEGRMRDALEDATALSATAEPERTDNYGTGELRIGAIGCFGGPDVPAGQCGPEWIEVVLSFISHDTSALAAGLPGRHLLCLEMWWPAEAVRPGLTGSGCAIPPQAHLYPFARPATAMHGADGTFTNYPWTPATDLANTYPTGTRTGNAVVDSVLTTLEGSVGALPAQIFEYTWIDCVAKIEGLGSPPECPEGVAEGTPVEAVLFLPCEGVWTRRDEIEANPRSLGSSLRPVAAGSAGGEGWIPNAWTVLVLVGPAGDPIMFYIGSHGIVAVEHGCGRPVQELIAQRMDSTAPWLLPLLAAE